MISSCLNANPRPAYFCSIPTSGAAVRQHSDLFAIGAQCVDAFASALYRRVSNVQNAKKVKYLGIEFVLEFVQIICRLWMNRERCLGQPLPNDLISFEGPLSSDGILDGLHDGDTGFVPSQR